MGWQSDRARLTPEEAKAQLLAIADESSPSGSLIGRHPWRALAIALAAGVLFARTPRLRAFFGLGTFWLLKHIVPIPGLGRPKDSPLERLKARVRRMD